MLFGNFKETPAGLFGNPLENFFAVRTRLLRVSVPATVASHATTKTSAAAKPASLVLVFVREQNCIHNGVCFLRALNGRFQVELAAAVHAVRKNDESLAALLFFHQLIGGKVSGVIKKSA